MIPAMTAGDALDELCVCVWWVDGGLRDSFDVWLEVKGKLLDLEDEDRAWLLASHVAGPGILDMRLRGWTLVRALDMYTAMLR